MDACFTETCPLEAIPLTEQSTNKSRARKSPQHPVTFDDEHVPLSKFKNIKTEKVFMYL